MNATKATRERGALAALVTAVALLLDGCGDGSSGEAEPEPQPAEATDSASEDAGAALEETAPAGSYAATYVLESANVPGSEVGQESTSVYTFKVTECDDSECTGTVKAPGEGTYTWNGTELTVVFDPIEARDSCVDDAGEKVEGATFRSRTEHGARLTAASGDTQPVDLDGTYSQATVYSDFRNGCEAEGPTRQRAKFSVALERK